MFVALEANARRPPKGNGGRAMRLNTILAIVLIVIGAIALVNGGINYTRTEKVIDIGPIEATAERRERIPLPPVLGGIALIGGIALLVVSARRRA